MPLVLCSASLQAQSLVDPAPEFDVSRYHGEGYLRTTKATSPNSSFATAAPVGGGGAVDPARYYIMAAEFPVRGELAADEPLRFVVGDRDAVGSGAKLVLKLQRAGQSSIDLLEQALDIAGTEWKERTIEFRAPQALPVPPGAATVLFFGKQAQKLEIAGLRLERVLLCLPLSLKVLENLGAAAETRTLTDPERGCFERVTTTRKPMDPSGVQLVRPGTELIRSGDWMTGTLWVRRSPGTAVEPEAELVLQRARTQTGDYMVIYTNRLLIASDAWREVPFCYLVTQSFNTSSTDAAQFFINLGFRVQSVDLAGFRLQNLGAFSATATLEKFTLYSKHPVDVRENHVWDGSLPAPFLRVETVKLPDNRWEGQLQYTWPEPIAQGHFFR